MTKFVIMIIDIYQYKSEEIILFDYLHNKLYNHPGNI